MKKKKSVKNKFLGVTFVSLMVLAIAIGLSSILVVTQLAKKDAEHLMTQICAEEALRFDNKLNLVHHSVTMIYAYIDSLHTSNECEGFSDEYKEKIENLALSIANETDGAMAVYYRFNPDIVGTGLGGFFWSKGANDAKFMEEQPTDILAYNANDIERVGWYYVPKNSGEPLWMTPYYNQNLDVFMISYIIPVYLDNGDFAGVVGMDIDFNTIMGAATNIKLYETGKIALVDLADHLLYTLSDEGIAVPNILSNDLYNHVTTIHKASDILEITGEDGTESFICSERLSNGMILFVSVPVSEIYADRNSLMIFIIAFTVILTIITMVVIAHNALTVIRPIKNLAHITDKYAKGDWAENYICNSSDEIQELSESILTMANNTQKYIDKINDIARTDGLTGVRNKTGYMEFTDSIRAQNSPNPYAIVVMDLNLLKKVNDNFGHEAGDALIHEASKYMKNIFFNSQIFRIGGDEFVAILNGEDFENRNFLMERFAANMNYQVEGANGNVLSIAYGMATFEEDGKEYDSIFKLADDRMYEKKKEMKMGRTD